VTNGTRPYLHVLPTYTERPIQVINLTKANVTPSPDVEALLGVSSLSLQVWSADE